MAATFGDLLGEIRGGPTFTPELLDVGGVTGGLGSNPITTNIPVVGGSGSTGGGSTRSTTGSTGGSTLCPSFSMWNPFCWGQVGSQASQCVGDFMLRIGLFILGFLCIAGAIYLYKGSGILAVPAKVARGAVKATTSALKAAAQSDE